MSPSIVRFRSAEERRTVPVSSSITQRITGRIAADAQRLAALSAQLEPARDVASAEVKQQLQAHTQAAIEAGVFGVPTFAVDDKLFWGQDALPMLRAYLQGDAWFDGPDWRAAQALPVGVRRQA